ncbi:dual specificity protein phosphatase family protein [Phenylobacterium sp. J426]|uniref:protein-tyrosine phosphatase family protein n=1 Tax=Phenylobacterium sp. J426 TaxID=2898439 RepID=UPI002151D307|nr:dual specificity protein phosphatase family protein [Phenylobacterium sp. J426]MCR5876150.1 dual specificity protein phosphatase family protein [Phenylobacterium sp. J426]
MRRSGPNFSWITPDLAVGGAFPRGHARALARDHGVGAVVDVRVEECDDPEELAACGLMFLHLPTEDLRGVSQAMLDEGVRFARDAASQDRRLLIHCQHGIGRSATVALCVLVDRGLSPMDALITAKDARALVSPSQSQFEAWAAWMRRRKPHLPAPSYHEFGCVAYRHLAQQA